MSVSLHLLVKGNSQRLLKYYSQAIILAPEFKKAEEQLQDKVHFGLVNSEEEGTLTSRFEIEDFPAIFIFGMNKTAPIEYKGDHKAENIIEKALEVLQLMNNHKLENRNSVD